MEFIKVPKSLLTSKKYSTLSMGAKLLYCLLADRFSLSAKNGWKDENGDTYIIFTRQQAADILNVGYKKVVGLFKELKNAQLIYEKIVPEHRANVIYVKNDISKSHTDICEKDTSVPVKKTDGDMSFSPISNTELNKTEINKTDIQSDIREREGGNFLPLCEILRRCNLGLWYDDTGKILKNAIEKLYYTDSLKIGGKTVTNDYIRMQLSKLTEDSVIFAVDNVRRNSKPVKNPEKYLLCTLVSAADDYAAEELIYSNAFVKVY